MRASTAYVGNSSSALEPPTDSKVLGSSSSFPEQGMLGVRVTFSPYLSRGSLIRGFHSFRILQDLGERLQLSAGFLGRHRSDESTYSRRFSGLQGQASAFATAQYAVIDEDRFVDSADKNTESKGSSSASEDGLDISKLPISREIVNALAKRGITHLFPIQSAVLQPAMRGQDLIARAKTGTGKTLAFGLPVLDRIIKENEKSRLTRRFGRVPLAVVLAPTRELAKQVESELKQSAPNVEIICVYGGVSIEAQQRQLQRGVDVAVGTPGRVIDLLQRGSLNLGEVQYIVLDEADRMLAVGFAEDVEKILQHLPSQRQSMLFSATMPDWVRSLSRKYLKNPTIIDLVGENDEKLAEGIKLLSVSTVNTAKRSILSDLITVYGKGGKTIVFTQTKREADDVAMTMGRMIGCEALHGDISQFQREKTLSAFREGRFSVLVATDVAARGLDIPNVDLVIHYELPNDPETFVHRSGRTGRAGREGIAILMHTEIQRRTLELIERDVGNKFQRIGPPRAEDVLRASAEQASTVLQKVHPDLRNVFLPTAEKLLVEQGPGALAAAIAHVCGFSQPPASRSLITHEQGWMTLRITCPGGPPIISSSAVVRSLSHIYPTAADSVGKICMLSGAEVEGAVFDLPEEVAKHLLSMKIESGETIDAPNQLPRIVEDLASDRYGRPPPRGGTRGGFRGSENPGSFFGGRTDGRFDGPNRSSSRPFDSGDWSSRPSFGSGGGDRWFAGKCLACGQPGHRAVDCPSARKGR